MGRLRYLTAGESHGEMLVGILEGMPAALSLVAARDIDPILRERQQGYGRGRRQQIEQDAARIVSGVRNGVTTGAPIGLLIQNKDWEHWKERMPIEPTEVSIPAVTIPRPGHADLAGAMKYGHSNDLRNVFERASARETAMRVAIGAIASTLLRALGMESISYVTAIGGIGSKSPEDIFAARERLAESRVRVFDANAEEKIIAAIDRAKKDGDSVGGSVECVVRNVPPGIGSHVHWDRKLDGLLAEAVMSIQAVKAVEIGLGMDAAARRGSETHDSILIEDGRIHRGANNAGGIEGGMSNGEPIVVRAAMKPISTLMRPLPSVDLATGEARDAHIERSDVCAVPALAVIVEQVVAMTIASEILEAFGGDTVEELTNRIAIRRQALHLNPVKP
ncbi:MAG TPA: chorismate synthase [Candidatus Kapabacteria bacterium]|nr:chorismate synthase [Candidatus Kapabacteria bacterium]